MGKCTRCKVEPGRWKQTAGKNSYCDKCAKDIATEQLKLFNRKAVFCCLTKIPGYNTGVIKDNKRS